MRNEDPAPGHRIHDGSYRRDAFMSLIRQFWIAIAVVMLLSLAAGLVAGTLGLASRSDDAYRSLQGTMPSLAWFAGGGLLCGLAGTLLLKRIRRPLRALVEQAQAIGDRRFITTPEPRTRELRAVVRSMNQLSARIRSMLDAEAQRLEELQRQTQRDEPTGLYSRRPFLNLIDSALAREDARAGGALVLVRLEGLARLNQRLGRAAADALLRTLAQRLREVAAQHVESDCGRLNAGDFAILTSGGAASALVADALDEALRSLLGEDAAPARLLIAATDYAPGESCSQLLARIDGALAAAAESGEARAQIAPGRDTMRSARPLDAWRAELEAALAGNRLRLEQFAVVSRTGALLHHEAAARMQLYGEWQHAGRFLPAAARLGMASAIDACVVRAAVRSLEQDDDGTLAINLSAEALCDHGFRDALYDILKARPRVARRLWIEVRELSALHHQVEFRALCLALRPLGCRVGLDHAGRHLSRFAELQDIGIDYLKISAAFVRGIDALPGNRAFMRGLCTIAHSIGLMTIAQGVVSPAERDCLAALGVDGMTGPGIGIVAGRTRPHASPEAADSGT